MTLVFNRDNVQNAVIMAASLLLQGRLVAFPTDTTYGLLAIVHPSTLISLREQRQREDKPFIVLLPAKKEYMPGGTQFQKMIQGESLSAGNLDFLQGFQENPVSFVLPKNPEFWYPPDQTTIAVRYPQRGAIVDLLQKTGPLFAPSLNLPEQPVITNLEEARNVFRENADYFFDENYKPGSPSEIISLITEPPRKLR